MSELSNEFAFSWSRHRAFYQCPRKLYWQCYGFWNGWQEDASHDSALAYRLKKLKSLSMLVGETFHEELAEILRRRADRPCAVPLEQLKADMERRLLKCLRESRNADWARYGDVKKYTILFEDYYQTGVNEQQQAEAIKWLHACVDGLAANPYGRRTFAVSKSQLRYLDPPARAIEQKRVVLNDLVLYASPDLVVEDRQGGFHVIDWKTGKTFKTNFAQLAIYGLFVKEKFGQPLERMTAHLIYVAAQRHEIINNITEGVEEAKREISTYVADVQGRLTDVSANVAGDIERFPMTENRALCRTCNYRELCNRVEETAIVPDSDE